MLAPGLPLGIGTEVMPAEPRLDRLSLIHRFPPAANRWIQAEYPDSGAGATRRVTMGPWTLA
jgi:hypothetical protein